jgi:hypothetical protein
MIPLDSQENCSVRLYQSRLVVVVVVEGNSTPPNATIFICVGLDIAFISLPAQRGKRRGKPSCASPFIFSLGGGAIGYLELFFGNLKSQYISFCMYIGYNVPMYFKTCI